MKNLLFYVFISIVFASCQSKAQNEGTFITSEKPYFFEKISENSDLPKAHSFETFVINNEIYAFFSQGIWKSNNGKDWQQTNLKPLKKNAIQTRYWQIGKTVYALGNVDRVNEDYQKPQFTSSQILKTNDFDNWEVYAQTSELPQLVEYELLNFKNKVYILGGRNKTGEFQQDVWISKSKESKKGLVYWRKLEVKLPFSAEDTRVNTEFLVFHDYVFAIQGNGKEIKNIWKTKDMQHWQIVKDDLNLPYFYSFSAFVFDDKIWLACSGKEKLYASNTGTEWRSFDTHFSTQTVGVVYQPFQNSVLMLGGKMKSSYTSNIYQWEKNRHYAELCATPKTDKTLLIEGYIRDKTGKNLPNTEVLIYHSNEKGSYEPLVKGNQNTSLIRGKVRTNQQGYFKFKTQMPGEYGNNEGTQHIHCFIKTKENKEIAKVLHFEHNVNDEIRKWAKETGFGLVIPLKKGKETTWEGKVVFEVE